MEKRALEDLAVARNLYKPTQKVEDLVTKLCDLFDTPLANGVRIDGVTFKRGTIKLGGLSVKELVRDTKYHCIIEVHWYPDFTISRETDPFCSAFALRYNSLEKLYRETEKFFSQINDSLQNVTK